MDQQKFPEKEKKHLIKSYAQFSSMAFKMIAIIAIGAFIGTKLDNLYPNKYDAYTIGVLLLSVILAIVLVVKSVISNGK